MASASVCYQIAATGGIIIIIITITVLSTCLCETVPAAGEIKKEILSPALNTNFNEEYNRVVCNAVQFDISPRKFRKNVSPQ